MRTQINKITAILLSILAVVSILTVIPAVEVNAAVDGTISWGKFDSSGHTRHYYIQNSNGKSLGFCVDPKLNSPDTGKYTFNQYTKENALISKIFYYGYQGIGNGKSITLNGVTKTANAFLTAKLASYGTASAGYNLHNMTHEALAYVYHGKNGNYCKYPNTAKAIADYISTFPAVPPATVYTSKGKTSNQQDIMYAEFWVHFLVIKNSSDDSTPASMAGVKYGIYNSSSKQIATVELEKNYSQTDASKKFQGTQAGVYVHNNSFSGVINLSGWKVNGKTAGSLYRMTDSSYTASETQTNSAFQKNNAKYTMVYYTNASDGHAILVPKLASNDTWPKDTLNIKLQMLKVSTNSSSPSPLTGAVYAVSNDKNCDFTKVAAGMRITIGADGYGALGQANSGNQRNRTTADGENAKYAGKPSGQTFSQTKGKKWYCKEIVAPRGYELDDRIYEFSYDNITDTAGIPIFRPAEYEGNQRKRLVSTDMPLVKLQLAKDSDIPEITNNNACYSLKDAEFDIFWKEDSAGTVSPGCDYTAYTGSGTSGYVIKTDSDGYGYISKDRDGNLIASSGTNRNDSEETVFYGKPSGPNIRLMPGRTYYCKERVSPNNFTKRDAYYKFVDAGVTDSDGIPIFRASNATMVDAESVFSAEGLWGDEHKSLTGNSNAITNAIVGDPFSLYINKTDSTYSGSGHGRSLSNAIFKVNYYDIESSSAEVDQIAVAGPDGSITEPPTLLKEIEDSNKAPKKTWYINTTYDSQTNKYYSSLEDARLTSFGVEQSSSLFKDANGQVFIPLGIVSVEEVQAPRGFQKTNNIYLYNLKYNDFASPEIENRPTIDIENTPTKAYVGVIKKNTEDERVAGALYYLYDSYEKASGSDFTNIENCIATATTTTAPEGDVFVNKTDGTTPYECISNKQYCIREVSAPEGYELDPTIYNITPKTTNNTVAKMATRTSIEGSVTYGSLKISKTSNDELVTALTYYNSTDVCMSEDDGSGNKVFLKDNTSLKNMCFAVWKYDGDTYDMDKDPMPTTELTPSSEPIEIGTTDENGEIQWDRLMVYKEGSTTEKQRYLVKELGYEVFFPEGTDRLVFQDGKFKWSIRKSNCIKIGNRYFEGLTNPVFTTNFKNLTNEVVSNVLYPKYFYGDKREAIGNARGKIITLKEDATVTEFAEPFHNTVPTTKLEIDKTMYTGEGTTALFELRSEYGNIKWSNMGISFDFCVQGSVEISGLPACVPKSDTSICIPMKYSITEKGLVTNGAITFVEGIMDKPTIEKDALYVPVEIDDRKVTFTAKNNPKTYTVSLHKDAFDENEEHNNVKDIWFEIVGVITDQTISDNVSAYNLLQTKASLPKFLALPKDEIKSELAEYYAAQCESSIGDDPYQQYFPGVSKDGIGGLGIYDCGDDPDVDRVLPILGYDKNGNPITRVTIKTDQNGDAQSHFFNGEEIVDNPEYVHLWSIQDNPDGTSTWIDRTAQDNVGSILYGRENTLLPEGERLDAREKLKGFVIHPMDEDIGSAINYAIGIRVSELGKLTDPSDPNSFAIDDRYIVPEPQYDICGTSGALRYTFENCPIVKDLELIKQNDSNEKLAGSLWLMYDKKTDSPIKVTYDQETEKYTFVSIGTSDELIDAETEEISYDYALVTNSDGNIYVKDIPYGEYYLKEEEPPIGYVPYGEPIYFEVTEEGNAGDVITKTYTVVDGSNIMPNTGGTKTVLPIVIVSIAIPAAILTTFYLFKKRKRKIK